MGTKVLSPDYTYSQTKAFIELISSVKPSIRKILSNLVLVQSRWVQNEHQQGVERSKSMLNEFKIWVSLGCNPEAIPPLANRHSLLGHLQDAMRLVVRCTSDRTLIINLICTALRYHELFGCFPEAREQKWKELRSVITHRCNNRPMAFAAMTHPAIAEQYLSKDELTTWNSMRWLMDFLWSLPKGYRGRTKSGSRRPLSHVYSKLRIKVDECEVLVKKSPHKFVDANGVEHRLVSIIGAPLDPYVLNTLVNARTTFYGITDAPVTRVDDSLMGKTIYDLLLEMTSIFIESQDTPESYESPRRDILGECPAGFKPSLGEIIPIQDKAGKLRPIATTVYTVNALLEPLHHWMFEILSQLPGDATKQSNGLDQAQLVSKNHGLFIQSTDLTSATDCLPRFVQRIVLEHFLSNFSQLTREQSSRVAYLWDIIMSSLTFQTIDGDRISYGTGQPMGVYTSWPMLALTNHAIGMTARHMVSPNSWQNRQLATTSYRVCGDDFFTWGSEEAALRYTVMMESFGVKVNSKKSYTSYTYLDKARVEFCKKLYVGGECMSGTSPKALIRSTTEASLVPQAIKSLRDLNGGKCLKQSTLARIAIRYPRILHHVPLEYGGLGFVNDVSRSAILSKDCFLLLYHWYKLKELKRFVPQTMFEKAKCPDSFCEQVGMTDSVPTQTRENPLRAREEEWRYLLNRKPLSGPEKLVNSVDYLIQVLSDVLFEGQIPDVYTDWINIVDLIVAVEQDVKPSLFLGTGSIEDRHDSYSQHSIQNAKTALNVVKFSRRVAQGKTKCYLLQHYEENKDVIVSLIEILDGTASGVWSHK